MDDARGVGEHVCLSAALALGGSSQEKVLHHAMVVFSVAVREETRSEHNDGIEPVSIVTWCEKHQFV